MDERIKGAVINAISRRCKELDKTLDYVAREMGIPHTTLSGYAKGKSLPGAENVVLLARALKITCDQLLGEANW